MITLPTERLKATRVNAKKIIIFSAPKTGKSLALSMLQDNLIVDLEDGSEFIDGLKINVLAIAKKEGISPLLALREVINKVKESNEKKGDFTYKYISIDTVSGLEEYYALDLALKLYKDTPIGRNFTGDDVRKLPNGAGYMWLRMAVTMILNEFEDLCDTLIITGHTKERVVDNQGKEMVTQALDLAGKLGSIICSQSDAICYLYRKNNQTIANFQPSEQLVVGARPEHLKGKEIILLESDENGVITDHWDQIFI